MKKIETLFEKRTVDTRKVLNRSNKIIDVALLDKIDEGVTSEFLNSIDVPIFTYQTQITVHGLFPTIGGVYVGGYKHIFQNKNKSVGIRYNAIDYAKKEQIYRILSKLDGWKTRENSTEYYAYIRSDMTNDRNVLAGYAKLQQERIKHIDTNLFVGGVSQYAYSYMGMYFVEVHLSVNVIKEKNVLPLIENVLKMNKDEIKIKLNEYDERKRKEREEYQKKWAKERENNAINTQNKLDELEPAMNEFKNDMLNNGYEVFNGKYEHGLKLVHLYKNTYDMVIKLSCINVFEKDGVLYFNKKNVSKLEDVKFAQNRKLSIGTFRIDKFKNDITFYIKK